MKVWVERQDKCSWIWKQEPCKTSLADCNMITNIHNSDFERLFGFTPSKGSCKEYELTLKEIKPLKG